MVVSIVHGLVIWVWRDSFEVLPTLEAADTVVAVEIVRPPVVDPTPPQLTAKQDQVVPIDKPARRVEDTSFSRPVSVPPPANDAFDEPTLDLSGRYADDSSATAKVLGPRQITSGLEFRPEFSEAVQKRRAEQAHQHDLSDARIARLGLDVETYNLVDSGNGHLKTEQGCFERRSGVVGIFATAPAESAIG